MDYILKRNTNIPVKLNGSHTTRCLWHWSGFHVIFLSPTIIPLAHFSIWHTFIHQYPLSNKPLSLIQSSPSVGKAQTVQWRLFLITAFCGRLLSVKKAGLVIVCEPFICRWFNNLMIYLLRMSILTNKLKSAWFQAQHLRSQKNKTKSTWIKWKWNVNVLKKTKPEMEKILTIN